MKVLIARMRVHRRRQRASVLHSQAGDTTAVISLRPNPGSPENSLREEYIYNVRRQGNIMNSYGFDERTLATVLTISCVTANASRA